MEIWEMRKDTNEFGNTKGSCTILLITYLEIFISKQIGISHNQRKLFLIGFPLFFVSVGTYDASSLNCFAFRHGYDVRQCCFLLTSFRDAFLAISNIFLNFVFAFREIGVSSLRY